ncbi:alpha/beta hydrolase [Streptomyces sp. NPDC090025]|uniref:alpha/beta hydrolase n=1 Tax=Streptomyces sp. NPDC090025 TaxID=3365922 RepID=UPI0038382D66
MAAALAALGRAKDRTPIAAVADLAAHRARDAASRPRPTLDELRDGGRFEVMERRVPGPSGAPEVTLVSARPAGAGGALPLLYYLHGGAMVMGNAWSVLPTVLREWVEPLGVAVLSVEYRLAPEAPYPAQVEDAYAGLEWAVAHAGEWGIDPGRLVIGGKSAGGGLAAALALLVRDRGSLPGALGQMLLSPMLDDRTVTTPTDPANSARAMSGVDVWDLVSHGTVWRAYLGERFGAAELPLYAAPGRAGPGDLAGLPEAYVEVGSAEMFRDEGVAYANALWRAGGQAELHVWAGACHGFDGIARTAEVTRAARRTRTAWLRRILARAAEG